MTAIRVLPEVVQNKIAAGEVIERPASAVKELAENALDAGAKHIVVELEDGGHRAIRVSDDGHGMDEADLVASLQRHATSKIADVDDIFRIATFGFRGEALPSMASVSRMTIATCLPGAKEGRELLVEAGHIVRVSPAPPRKGTRVEVRDIFHNTPARRKFLRPAPAEVTRAAEVVTRLALGNPGVGFRLQSGDRQILALHPAATQLERIIGIYGEQLAGKLIPFRNEITDGLSVSGFFARPPESRRNSKDVSALVNRRWIRFFGLARAVADAFQGILPPREYPFAVINLDVDPARVDVNAHPAKEEVRFEQEKLLISGVRRAIREALEACAALPTARTFSAGEAAPEAAADGAPASAPPPRPHAAHAEPRPRAEHGAHAAPHTPPRERGEQKAFSLPASFVRPKGGGDFSGVDFAKTRDMLRPTDRAAENAPAPGSGHAASDAPPPPPAPRPARAPPPAPSAPSAPEPERALPLGPPARHRVLGQASGKYIVVDGPEGILLVDPHALHERWNFDRLLASRKSGGDARRLLLPLEMHLAPAEAAAAGEAVPGLAEYGFEFEFTSPNRLRVTAAPAFLPPQKLETLLRQVFADAGEQGEAMDAVEAARERVLASLACRSSVLLGKTLPEEEMLSLLDTFFHRGQLPTCPHGRPTAIRLGWDELARRFGR